MLAVKHEKPEREQYRYDNQKSLDPVWKSRIQGSAQKILKSHSSGYGYKALAQKVLESLDQTCSPGCRGTHVPQKLYLTDLGISKHSRLWMQGSCPDKSDRYVLISRLKFAMDTGYLPRVLCLYHTQHYSFMITRLSALYVSSSYKLCFCFTKFLLTN